MLNPNKAVENYVPKFHSIKMDDTVYWDKEFVKSLGEGSKIISTYIYDANHVVHCCEITPSYELYYAGTDFFPTKELSDEENQETFEKIMEGESDAEPAIYMHCSFVEKYYDSKPVSAGYSYKGQGELTPEEQMKEILEYYQSNPW